MKKLFMLLCICLFVSFPLLLEAQSPRTAQDYANDALAQMEKKIEQQEATAMDAYYLGRAVAANILSIYKPYTENEALTRYVNSICQTLVINSLYPDLFNGYHVILLDSQEINAFASPGGHVFLTRGLVEAAASEDMLASVIAHELAHIMLKHSLSIIENIRLLGEMAATAEQAAQFTNNKEAVARLQYFQNSVVATINALMINGFSRDQEFEADAGAAVLMAAAGYNPTGLLDMLSILQRVQNTQKGGFNTTHPSPADRIASVRSVVNLYKVQDTQASRAARFKNK